MKKNKKAFTLLEILMVLVIISILAALAIPQYMKVARKGHAAEAVSNIGDIKGAELRYYAEYGAITTDLNLLDIENPTGITGAKFTYTVSGSTPDNLVITATGSDPATTNPTITVTYDASTGKITTDLGK